MKKVMIPSVILLILSFVVIIGSQTFLSPCIHEDGSHGACYWAGQTLLGLGGVLACLSILSMFVKGNRHGVFLSAIPIAILGVFTPGTLIDLCHMSTMRCRMIMQPAMMILFISSIVIASIGAILTARDDQKK